MFSKLIIIYEFYHLLYEYTYFIHKFIYIKIINNTNVNHLQIPELCSLLLDQRKYYPMNLLKVDKKLHILQVKKTMSNTWQSYYIIYNEHDVARNITRVKGNELRYIIFQSSTRQLH